MQERSLQSRIILSLSKDKPMRVRAIAEKVKGSSTAAQRQWESHCSYQLQLLEAAGIVTSESQTSRRKVYWLAHGVEILDGLIELKNGKGIPLYKHEIHNVLRMTTETGEIVLKILN